MTQKVSDKVRKRGVGERDNETLLRDAAAEVRQGFPAKMPTTSLTGSMMKDTMFPSRLEPKRE